jgi:hypothetical protein
LYSADRNTTNKVLVIVSKEQLCRSLERTEMNINGAMTPEVQAAAKFISTCLYGKLPRRRADIYGVEFSSALTRKFQGHWYLEAPSKGSAYRCIHFTSKEIDPVFQQAADAAGVLFNEVSVSDKNLADRPSPRLLPAFISNKIHLLRRIFLLNYEFGLTQAKFPIKLAKRGQSLCFIEETNLARKNSDTIW